MRPGPAALEGLHPVGSGLLDLRVPWTTLIGQSGEPGQLSRLGPITPAQARDLADLAAGDSAVRWRVIVTSADGRALASTRVRRRPAKPMGSGNTGPTGPGPVSRVTVTISRDALEDPLDVPSGPRATGLPEALARVLHAAEQAAEHADQQATADAVAPGGCAHREASLAYRPTSRLWEYIIARDVTCRFPTCRQPAWRCDLDHTKPYDKGGRTCSCNLGGLCRFHHQLKQHHLWRLTQAAAGIFTWRTPAGRSYSVGPDTHAA